MVFVCKGDGVDRLDVDFWKINAVSQFDTYPEFDVMDAA